MSVFLNLHLLVTGVNPTSMAYLFALIEVDTEEEEEVDSCPLKRRRLLFSYFARSFFSHLEEREGFEGECFLGRGIPLIGSQEGSLAHLYRQNIEIKTR